MFILRCGAVKRTRFCFRVSRRRRFRRGVKDTALTPPFATETSDRRPLFHKLAAIAATNPNVGKHEKAPHFRHSHPPSLRAQLFRESLSLPHTSSLSSED